jgi:hypothetical protein
MASTRRPVSRKRKPVRSDVNVIASMIVDAVTGPNPDLSDRKRHGKKTPAQWTATGGSPKPKPKSRNI